MQFRLEKRLEASRLVQVASPAGAVLLTMVAGAIVFGLLGFDGLGAVREIFLAPLINSYKWQDLAVKAAPLAIIAVGLSISYRANVWNIGAEGQYIVGAVVGTGVGLATNTMTGWWIMPLMMLAGVAGGAAYAAVPAFLRVRFRLGGCRPTHTERSAGGRCGRSPTSVDTAAAPRAPPRGRRTARAGRGRGPGPPS